MAVDAAAAAVAAPAASTATAAAAGPAATAGSAGAGGVQGGIAPGMDMANGAFTAKTLGTPMNPMLPQAEPPPALAQSHSTLPHYPQQNGLPPQLQTQDQFWGDMVNESLLGRPALHALPDSVLPDAHSDGRTPLPGSAPETARPQTPDARALHDPTPSRERVAHPDESTPEHRANTEPEQPGPDRWFGPSTPTPDDRTTATPDPKDRPEASSRAPHNGARANQPLPDIPRAPGDDPRSLYSSVPVPAFNRPPADPGFLFEPIPEGPEPDNDWLAQIRRGMRGSSDPDDKRAVMEMFSNVPELGDWANWVLLIHDVRERDVSAGTVVSAVTPFTKGRMRAAAKLGRQLRNIRKIAKAEEWARSKLRAVERGLKRRYSLPGLREKLKKGPSGLRYETDIGPIESYAGLVGRTDQQAHHLFPQTFFWNGPLETAALADYIPAIPLSEAEHLEELHPLLNAYLRSTGLWGKETYTQKDIARALKATAAFYRSQDMTFAAQALEQFSRDIFARAK